LIQGSGDKEKMTIQVTYFEAKRTRVIKYAKEVKTILCNISGDRVEIKKSDYSKNDMKTLFPDILQGIRNKKKFLKLIDRKDKL
jgi:predicted small secreted protein